jgi:hypothetical protein
MPSAGEYGWGHEREADQPSRSVARESRTHAGGELNLDQLRRLDADAEAAVRRISVVKLTATILIVYAVTLAAMLLLALLNG